MNPAPLSAALTASILPLLASSAAAAQGEEIAKLLATDHDSLDYFGEAVAVSGTTAVVGARGDDESGANAGAAYFFDALTGQQLLKLVADDTAESDAFGCSVSAHGDRVLVGATGAGEDGAAYLFDLATGQQIVKYLPPGGAQTRTFGSAVALHGDRALIGAPWSAHHGSFSGAAFVFEASTGSFLFELVPAGIGENDRFGGAVAIHGSLALVGAIETDVSPGYASLFDVSTGAELGRLEPGEPLGSTAADYGGAVALHGNLALVGARGADGVGTEAGGAFLFDAPSLQRLVRLRPNDAHQFDRFGSSVALSEGLAVVGALEDNPNGALYLFDLETFQQIAELDATDAGDTSDFGAAAAIDGTLCVGGAPLGGPTPGGELTGAAYVFTGEHSVAIPYCFGFAPGPGDPCPCGNEGQLGRGCGNSAFAQGARLWGEGAANVTTDGLILRVGSSRPLQNGLFFQGDNALNGGLGLPFGDGLRCAGGGLLRLELDGADQSGSARTTIPIAATAGISPGDTQRYQWWYRDPGASPCGSGFNLSNGLEVPWGP